MKIGNACDELNNGSSEIIQLVGILVFINKEIGTSKK
jgi:hypothetical protein